MKVLRKIIEKASSLRSALILGLFTVLLLMPSANYLIFSGIPLSGLPEFLTFALLLPMLFSQGLRRIYHRLLMKRFRWYGQVLLWGGLAALVAKVVLLGSGTYEGFSACYSTPLSAPPVGECEKAYENPFYRFGVTRIDRTIDFDEDEWNLSFFNSMRFNYYPWEDGVLSRHRLPLQATWSGIINAPKSSQVEVTYVGEVTVDLGHGPTSLPPSYDRPSTAILPLSSGDQRVVVEFHFDDGYRTGQPEPPGPYAMMKMHLLEGGQEDPAPSPLTTSSPLLIYRSIAILADTSILAFFLGLLALYWKYIKADWWVLAATAVLGAAIFYYLPESRWLPKTRGILVLIGGLFLYMLVTRRHRGLLTLYFSLLYLSVLRSLLYVPALNTVLLRDGGTDFLTYESFAHTILETGSLEGGEAIFYYQPLFRYFSYGTHFILGDGDPLIAILALTFLNFGVFLMFTKLYPRDRVSVRELLLPALAGLFLFALINSWYMVYFIHIGASEYPTWILLSYMLCLLFLSGNRKGQMAGILLLGVSLLLRPNHGLSILALLAVFIISTFRKDKKIAVAAGILLFVMALLPAVHNLYYGRELVFLPRSAGIKENLVLPPWALLTQFDEPGIRAKAWEQFQWLFYLKSGEAQFLGLSIALHGLQVLWLVSMGRAFFQRRLVSWMAKAILLLPLLHLGVQYFFVLNAVYPRHIIMGHIAMGVVVVFALSPWASSQESRRA